MKFALIICTYKRPQALQRLLQSVLGQSLYPDEILIIDGSPDRETEKSLKASTFKNLSYVRVSEEDRGLTKQRNFGIQKVSPDIEVVCFLDDDTTLEVEYFEAILQGFNMYPDAIGMGGIAVNENRWKKNIEGRYLNTKLYYCFEGYYIKESARNVMRNYFGLQSTELPGVMPPFSHGRTYSYPLNGEVYAVDMLVGMSMSFRKSVFSKISFSLYFHGYGLYEDADFCLRALSFGQNYINTNARLNHFHEESGRPDAYRHGKMVVKNGWYVWRVRWPRPSLKAQLTWHAITWLLIFIRLTNVITTKRRKKAFTESLGRMVAWWQLLIIKP